MTFNDIKIIEVAPQFKVRSIMDIVHNTIPVTKKLLTTHTVSFDEVPLFTKSLVLDGSLNRYVDALTVSLNSDTMVDVNNQMFIVAKYLTKASYMKGLHLYTVILKEGGMFSENGMLFKLEKGKFVLTSPENVQLVKFSEHRDSLIKGVSDES